MDNIKKRIRRIETEIRNKVGITTVFYKDGSSKVINTPNMIDLILTQSKLIDRFEEQNGHNNGRLEELCNDLLTI